MKVVFQIMILSAIMLFANGLLGQATLQVVSKKIEKSWPYVDGSEVNIEGEKAKIKVETWESNEVKIVVEIISKHPDKKTAERDVKAMIFKDEQHSNNIYFRNYVNKDLKPESDLSVTYTVTLPADCPVYLKNNFGLTYVSDLTNALTIVSEFSKIFLNNLKGNIGVTTRFGDVDGEFIDGNVKINSRRSDVTLREIKGNWDINSKYGVIKLFTVPYPSAGLLSLNIDAEKADVYFFDPQPDKYGFNLRAKYGDITVPHDLKLNYIENTEEMKTAIFSSKMGDANSISIKISFGDIIIKNP
ncbi:MAG: hypothetical protein ACI9XO_000934 [Paraglaciecola sp.]|jgi:hypothetical protein